MKRKETAPLIEEKIVPHSSLLATKQWLPLLIGCLKPHPHLSAFPFKSGSSTNHVDLSRFCIGAASR